MGSVPSPADPGAAARASGRAVPATVLRRAAGEVSDPALAALLRAAGGQPG